MVSRLEVSALKIDGHGCHAGGKHLVILIVGGIVVIQAPESCKSFMKLKASFAVPSSRHPSPV